MRSPASTGGEGGIDERFKNHTLSPSDREIIQDFPQTAPEDIAKKQAIEEGRISCLTRTRPFQVNSRVTWQHSTTSSSSLKIGRYEAGDFSRQMNFCNTIPQTRNSMKCAARLLIV